MSVKMRESADVVIFSMADQKYDVRYFRAPARPGGAGAAQPKKVFAPERLGGPSRFVCEIYLREKFSKSGNRTSWVF